MITLGIWIGTKTQNQQSDELPVNWLAFNGLPIFFDGQPITFDSP